MTRSTNSGEELLICSTTVSDTGYVRSDNQDSSFAGQHLIAMCDGMGGHAGGDTASTIAIRSLAHIEYDNQSGNVKRLAQMMDTSVIAAHDAIVGKAKRERRLSGMGTTVTAIALAGGHWVLAHIGDSRGYLLRDGRLLRMTQDHSYVQHLIDTGRISAAEAKNHPQRNVVMRVLGDFDIDPHPDIAIHKAQPGDRWMLCSDGLCGVLEDSTIAQTLSSVTDQEECAQQLVTMALKGGSTDNVTVVIGDATLSVDTDAIDLPQQTPLIGGAASSNLEALADIVHRNVAAAPHLQEETTTSPAQRAAALAQSVQTDPASDGDHKAPKLEHKKVDQSGGEPEGNNEILRLAEPSESREEAGDRAIPDTGEIPIVHKKDGSATADPYDPDVAKAINQEYNQRRKRERARKHHLQLMIAGAIVTIISLLGAGTYGAYYWSQQQYYLGEDASVVTIYQGVPTNVFGLNLSHPVEHTDISVHKLPLSWREQLQQGITVSSREQAQEHANLIRHESHNLQESGSGKNKHQSTSTPSAPSRQPSGKPSIKPGEIRKGATPTI
ncbi:PP2C family protein-serine/threonine phosphatase [Bombiscardovia coagulans]|uniref:Phosphoprotein phosphatase n=1 Tax=Bombiscardovia coagulans TaxID=686666 RepID=A0A261EQD2_9BIFI|nr:protein phosphatase 2C domain-containing protein [Bombiscardovia coagulans]OZG49062.1 phosphoprotein phosphatase [Bombiscardovia coagulans]